ncbi:hypothetical protein ACN47E_000333 [Coniothyrium glycines]
MELPSSLSRDISPPRPLKRRKTRELGVSIAEQESLPKRQGQESPIISVTTPTQAIEPTLAAVEAGRARIDNHLTYFSSHLLKASRKTGPEVQRLSIDRFSGLYHDNEHEHGHHFVIHQHNHPIAGVHYDLRLQFSKSSSMSFAIPKGLPGNPNSRSIGRMAIETRVHNYWNHLIESASSKTGSLLIWDTGTYEVLPRIMKKSDIPSPQTTDDEECADEPVSDENANPNHPSRTKHENEKLITAFQTRYIRLRLHGTRLPQEYTIILRLPSNETIRPRTTRRKPRHKSHPPVRTTSASHSEDEHAAQPPPPPPEAHPAAANNNNNNNLDTDSDEDAQTRQSNAYRGATNDIGSIHQRHWFLQLDRQHSGLCFDATQGKWVASGAGTGFEAFTVRGREHERSVVTGRLARDVERDEGVEGYAGRGGWTGIED